MKEINIHHKNDQPDGDDNLTSIFRERAEKLAHKPSPLAWDRLENKLEARRHRKRAIMYRYTSMAAAAIGLIALIMAVGLLDDFSSQTAETASAPQEMTDDERKIAEAIQRHRQERQAEMEGAFVENEEVPEKKVIGNNAIEADNSSIPNTSNIPKPVAPQNPQNPQNTKRVAPSTAVVASDEVADELVIEEEETDDVAMGDSDNNLPSAPSTNAKVKESKPSLVSPQKTNSANNIKDNNALNSSKDDFGNDTQLEAEQPSAPNTYQNKARTSKRKGEFKDEFAASSLTRQFAWMDGNWRDANSENSFEEWYFTGEEMVGRGFVINDNNDTTFTEYMRIYQVKKDVFFETAINDSRQMERFKLIDNKSNQVVFERQNSTFPNQVIIQQSGDNANQSFIIIYKDKKDQDIPQKQTQYLNNRNTVQPSQAIRKMMRN